MAIQYGMSYDMFWYGNAEEYWAYRFAYISKLKLEQEIFNQNAWLQGVYFFDALSKALYNSNRTKESQEVQMYMDKPINFDKSNVKEEVESIEEKQIALENQVKVYVQNYQRELNKKNKRK